MAADPQVYRITIAFDYFGTYHEAEEEAYHAVRAVGHDAEFVGLTNEDWEEV